MVWLKVSTSSCSVKARRRGGHLLDGPQRALHERIQVLGGLGVDALEASNQLDGSEPVLWRPGVPLVEFVDENEPCFGTEHRSQLRKRPGGLRHRRIAATHQARVLTEDERVADAHVPHEATGVVVDDEDRGAAHAQQQVCGIPGALPPGP